MGETPRHVLVVFGTRPEAIKLLPVIRALTARPRDFRVELVNTGQHRELLHPLLELLDLRPDTELRLMQPGQALADLTAGCLTAIAATLERIAPELVIVQGDTTTAFAAALAAFYARLPVAHVEAGLRSGAIDQPFPEELNRRAIDQVARFLFAPTATAAERLRSEGAAPDRVFLTGNTVVDALELLRPRLREPRSLGPASGFERRIVVTCHRREAFGAPLLAIASAVKALARRYPGDAFVWPLHPNPHVAPAVTAALGGEPNVFLLPPLRYDEFLGLLSGAYLVLTDSGGVQEEAPSFGVPALILREQLDRPEGIGTGGSLHAGVREPEIVALGARLLDDRAAHAELARAPNPFGDGRAAERIAEILAASP
jgi:UDP-N-acetylglucosamine 2-epimerase (non-hydrolysing)